LKVVIQFCIVNYKMKNQATYKLYKLSKSDFQYIVLTLNSTRIDNYLNEIESYLAIKKIKGSIVFDLLIMNGMNDRYYSADFDGVKFNLSSFKSIKSNDEIVFKTSNSFFSKHIDLIEQSSLPKTKKFLIKKQLATLSA
jgi:uncharacterized protein YlbG (UPF0298 family)